MSSRLLNAFVRTLVALVLSSGVVAAYPLEPAANESKRMSQAKDFIADEQWHRAIAELRAAVNDSKEPNKDEALFWLAHSQNQIGELPLAVENVRRLQKEYPSSRWVKPAQSLLIELAQKLRRNDVITWIAVPPPPPATTQPHPPAPPAPGATPMPRPPRAEGRPPRMPPRPAEPAPVVVPAPPAPPAGTPPPHPPDVWFQYEMRHDTDLRIQALSRLIHTDADKAIHELKTIALEPENPNAAKRAVFVLAASGRPEAQSTVLEIAKVAAEPVRVTAVRELGRFGGPKVGDALLQVYSMSNEPVKLQVVTSLGRVGGREQLRTLYTKASADMKRPIILSLFSARADDELIDIADREKDQLLRAEAISRLRLLSTPKARAYIEKVSVSR